MRRIAVPLVAAISVFGYAALSAQAPASGVQIPRPGTPTGAAAPGMPAPRDKQGAVQSGTASLRGRVVSAQTGMPLRRAQVTIIVPELQMRRVTTTDPEGRYEFRELPAGRFQVSAIKAGYVTLQYGQRRPFEAGTPVTVADGEMVERIDFSLPAGSVIVVRVTDDFGEPVAGAQVQVQRFQYAPKTSDLHQLVDVLVQLYAERRVTIINTIYSGPLRKLQDFADAFRFRNKEKD